MAAATMLPAATQAGWVLAVMFAMIAAGISKRRLEWKRKPPRRRGGRNS
jgi:hypothetical protein